MSEAVDGRTLLRLRSGWLHRFSADLQVIDGRANRSPFRPSLCADDLHQVDEGETAVSITGEDRHETSSKNTKERALTVYHRTAFTDRILREGFRDTTGKYGTDQE